MTSIGDMSPAITQTLQDQCTSCCELSYAGVSRKHPQPMNAPLGVLADGLDDLLDPPLDLLAFGCQLYELQHPLLHLSICKRLGKGCNENGHGADFLGPRF